MKPVFLWTDAMIWLLVAFCLIGAWYAARREHLRAPWRRVVESRVGMSSLAVLGVFIVIGLADSLHFHPRNLASETATAEYSNDVLSVFDVIATPLRDRQERTYSAPFARHAYVKETIERPDGSTVRDYPPLKWGGAHLEPGESTAADIAKQNAIGMLKAFAAWIAVAAIIVAHTARRAGHTWRAQAGAIARARTRLRWRAALIALGIVLGILVTLAHLSLYYHVFGTDKVGEDVFYQALKSVRTGLVIGTVTTFVMLPLAVLLGIAAGYFRGWIDDVIQYLYTTLNSIPGVLLIAAAVLMLEVYMSNNADAFASLDKRADLRLLFLCLILGVTSWTGLCRLLRGETMKLREIEYVQAADAFGVARLKIILRHLLPNLLHIVLISVALDFSGLVLAEAVLSYVEIGVDPTMNSWGNMINSARLELAREPVVWWSLAAAFAFMFTMVLFANLLADTVRDAFDPRLKHAA